MTEVAWTWHSEQHFPTDTSGAKRVLDELLERLAEHQWDEREVFGIHMAVEEALMNAMKHGNQLDSNKLVHMQSRLSGDRFEVEIEDEGEGFDPEDVPDPTAEENLELPSGRGLMLMRSFMTLVQFNERGNRVLMVKQRERDAE